MPTGSGILGMHVLGGRDHLGGYIPTGIGAGMTPRAQEAQEIAVAAAKIQDAGMGLGLDQPEELRVAQALRILAIPIDPTWPGAMLRQAARVIAAHGVEDVRHAGFTWG